MVFKEGTFHGKQPEYAETPHPAWLETAVADALAAAGDLDASDVRVTCEGSNIILTGNMASEDEVRRATEVAASVQGAESVENRISAL